MLFLILIADYFARSDQCCSVAYEIFTQTKIVENRPIGQLLLLLFVTINVVNMLWYNEKDFLNQIDVLNNLYVSWFEELLKHAVNQTIHNNTVSLSLFLTNNIF